MPPEYWNTSQTESDSHRNNFESYNGEGSALFAKQPQWARATDFSPRYSPYTMFALRVKVFKDIARVPNITLNSAQTEGVMPVKADSVLSLDTDFSSSSSSIDRHSYTPPLSSTPTSVNSDLSPITTSDQIFDSFSPFSHPLSPLPSNSLCLSDDVWNVSPISSVVDLPSLESFADSPNEHQFHQLDRNLHELSPVSIIDPTINTSCDTVVPLDEEEEKLIVKRRRCTSSGPALESPSASLPIHHRGTGAAKKALRNTKAIVARTQRKGPTRSHASESKYVLELSSENWLKLSPPSITEQTSPYASHPSPPRSLSPSATPELSNVRKRKRSMTSPLVTPLQSPLPVRLLSVDRDVDAPSPPLSSASNGSDEESEREDTDLPDDYIDRDFIAARAMAQRRSERTRAPINYAGCDEDVFEKPARGKATAARAKTKAGLEEFKGQAPRTAPKKGRRSGPKRPQNTNNKCECPFHIICPIPFGRFSDVVRHLESNVLHTHAEKARWECPNCHARLARSDSYKRHINAQACGKRAPAEKVKPVYSPEVERELERIRNSSHPAILAAKERL